MADYEPNTDLSKLEAILGATFTDQTILKSAITHRSYLNEHREATWDHNERLEFLGDAVLELVVTDFLFKKYPDKPEGELTAVRAALAITTLVIEFSSPNPGECAVADTHLARTLCSCRKTSNGHNVTPLE